MPSDRVAFLCSYTHTYTVYYYTCSSPATNIRYPLTGGTSTQCKPLNPFACTIGSVMSDNIVSGPTQARKGLTCYSVLTEVILLALQLHSTARRKTKISQNGLEPKADDRSRKSATSSPITSRSLRSPINPDWSARPDDGRGREIV